MSKLFPHHRGQMSEAFRTVMFLSASGGLQDAYTYIGRGKVFANAQTGNIVLMSQSLFDGNLSRFAHYFIPVLSFALGAGIGTQCVGIFGERTIWLSCALLLVSLCFMFIKEDLPEIEDELKK